MKRVTQEEVARAAGVSRTTVSLTLNPKAGKTLPEATRRRVLKAAEKLGYRANPVAQKLAGGRNRLIGVFVFEPFFPYEQDSFLFPFLLGIERKAADEGYDLLLYTRNHNGRESSLYRDGGNVLTMVDGAVLMGSATNREEIKRSIEEKHHLVYIGHRSLDGCEIDWVSSDYRKVSQEATEHLIGLGHTRIGYTDPLSHIEPDLERLEACRQVVSSHQGAELIVIEQETWRDMGALERFINQAGITALIFTCSDRRAVDFIHSLHDQTSLRVPEQLSILSLSDEEEPDPKSGVYPTCVNLNKALVGEEAVRLLVRRLNGEGDDASYHVRVPCSLIHGNTVAALRQST